MSVRINWYLHCSDVRAELAPYHTVHKNTCNFCSFVLGENLQTDILKTMYNLNIWHL